MSPQNRRRALTITITGAALASAVAAVPYAAGSVRFISQHIVTRDTFVIQRSRDSTQRLRDRERDSLVQAAQFTAIVTEIHTMKKDLTACIRHPDLCR